MRWGFSIVLLLLAQCFASAHSAQTGRINYPYLGIQFTIPQDWQGAQNDDIFLMGSNREPGLLGIMLNEAKSPNELKKEADKGIIDESTQLMRSGEFIQIGPQGLGAEFEGYVDGQKAKAFLVGLINPYGQSITIAALTSVELYSQRYQSLAVEIAESVAFAIPKESQITKQWRQSLKGRRLSYRYSSYSSGADYYDESGQTYGSYSSVSQTTNIDLCSDNTFFYYSSNQSSFDSVGGFGGGGASNDTNGSWEVLTLADGKSMLKLQFQNGNTDEYDLTYDDGKTFLDSDRYFRIESPRCS